MLKNGHPVSTHRESGIAPDFSKGETWGTEYDGKRFDEIPEETRELIKKWVFDNFEPASSYTSRGNYTSYGWKHLLEKIYGVPNYYMSNDQAKDAFLSWGFKPRDVDEINWVFKLKPKSRKREAFDSQYYRNGIWGINSRIEEGDTEFWRHEDLSKYNGLE